VLHGNEEHCFLILDQLREASCTPSAVLVEPAGRNTAPAVTLAPTGSINASSCVASSRP
jgi:mannose-1-phosphate guanylyltransferase/mannose-6-phosphate isomerase